MCGPGHKGLWGVVAHRSGWMHRWLGCDAWKYFHTAPTCRFVSVYFQWQDGTVYDGCLHLCSHMALCKYFVFCLFLVTYFTQNSQELKSQKTRKPNWHIDFYDIQPGSHWPRELLRVRRTKAERRQKKHWGKCAGVWNKMQAQTHKT